MQPQLATRNAVIAIRVSSTRQGTDGDSPEAQREQLIQYAIRNGITIKETFVFLESGSKVDQPMQQAINYCKDPKNDTQLFIIKSIDRFTRGGVNPYEQLKQQLEHLNISLVDIYGVISAQRVNTLDHLGIEYSWSKYSPSQKTEYLEAERAKDELRDILSRMIGAEVRYARLGYWMRQPPYGYLSEKVETTNGKRCILRPHPMEGPLIIKLFELRAEGLLSDFEICERLNELGFRTRQRYRTVNGIKKLQGGVPLTPKAIWKTIRNPIYAGISKEKWTDYKPIKSVFEGLVDIDLFNQANKGKYGFIIDGSKITEIEKQLPANVLNRGLRSADFPYRKFIGCSICTRPLLGSASKGKSGKYYPAYHCSNHGHYFRVPKKELEDKVIEFVSCIEVTGEKLERLFQLVIQKWEMSEHDSQLVLERHSQKVTILESQIETVVRKIKMIESATAIKYLEEDLMKTESELTRTQAELKMFIGMKQSDIEPVIERTKYFLEHLDQVLVQQSDSVKKAQFFGILFDRLPLYSEINPGTQNSPELPGVNPLFQVFRPNNSLMVTWEGIEPPTPTLGRWCSIH